MQREAPRDARDAVALAVAAGIAFFVVYARRLCPTLSLVGDSGELVTAAAIWGVPHAPGYPLFTTLGHAFTWLPFGTIAWRVHLTSAVFHAVAVGVTILATFSITRSRVAAVGAGLALGLERSFFLGSLYAEVFPLNDLFFATLLLLALRLRAKTTSPVTFAIVLGLAAAHHMTIALTFPALAVLAWRPLARHCAGRAAALRLAAAVLVPFVLSYALVPLAASRDPALSWGDVHDGRSFFALLARSDYGGLFSAVHGAGHGTGAERASALAGLLVTGFGVLTLLGAAIGAVDLLRRDRAVGASLVVAAVFTGPMFAWWNALGTGTEEALAFFERFTTLCAVPIALAFGAGIAAVASALPASRPARVTPWILIAGWAALSFHRVAEIDLSDDARSIAFAHDLVLRSPDRSLLLLSGDAPSNAALYVCDVERLCGQRIALSPGSLFMPWAMSRVRRRHPDLEIPWSSGPALKRTHELAAAEAPLRPVLVSPDLLEKDPLLAQTFTALPDHLLFRLWPRDGDAGVAATAFVASARAIALPDPGECEGCALPAPTAHPSQEMQLVRAYEAAAANHARAAAGVPEARSLVAPLLARAGEYAQVGGFPVSSPERPSTDR